MKWRFKGAGFARAEEFVEQICHVYQVRVSEEDRRMAVWKGVCYACRTYSRNSRHEEFWDYAFRCAQKELFLVVREEQRWRQMRSLDAPVSWEDDTPRRERWLPIQGDFVNGVVFWDYVERLEEDAYCLARGLMAGYSCYDVAVWYDWSPYQLSCARSRLTRAMADYQND